MSVADKTGASMPLNNSAAPTVATVAEYTVSFYINFTMVWIVC